MARKPRNTKVYREKRGRETTYIGITDNLPRRELEHRNEGHTFTKIEPVSPALTRKSAEVREQQMLQNFEKNHGRLPKYNIDPNG